MPLLLGKRNRNHLNVVAQDSVLPNFKECFGMLLTFLLTVLAWIFFRSENITHAFNYIQEMLSKDFFTIPLIRPKDIIILVFVFMIIEWIGRKHQYAIEVLFRNKSRLLKWSFYMILMALVLLFSNETPQEFIYFQF